MKFLIFGLGASVDIRPHPGAWVAELLCHPRGLGPIMALKLLTIDTPNLSYLLQLVALTLRTSNDFFPSKLCF